MPLTSKGRRIFSKMRGEYGAKKGESVFYASRNAGTISGVDAKADCAGTMDAGQTYASGGVGGESFSGGSKVGYSIHAGDETPEWKPAGEQDAKAFNRNGGRG